MSETEPKYGLICGPFDMINGLTPEQIAADAERMREAGRRWAMEREQKFLEAVCGPASWLAGSAEPTPTIVEITHDA